MAEPRLLFVCPSLEVGGAERYLSLLVPALRERGFDPVVMTLRARGRFFDELGAQGISTRFVEVRSRFDVAGVRRAVRAAGSWPDVVVSQSLDAQLVGHLIARRARARHLTVHHKQPEVTLAPHQRLLTRLVAPRIDRVIAVSAAQIPDLAGLGFPVARVRVIENGVAAPQTTRAASDVRAELGLAPSDFVALLVATLRPEKRAGVFVDAVLAAQRRESDIRGLVAGRGPDLERIRARARGSEAVLVLGERSDVGDLMAAADVVCLTSSAEALPMVVLEAMAMGRPVLATDVGGVAEAVLNGETGVIVPVDSGETFSLALCDLARDRAAVARMGEGARSRHAQRYSSELMADRYAEQFRELVDGEAVRR